MEDLEVLDPLIIEHVTRRANVLKKHEPDKSYKAEELCVDFWKDFDGLHPFIGKRIKKLSEYGKLPIETAGHTSSNQRLYLLK